MELRPLFGQGCAFRWKRGDRLGRATGRDSLVDRSSYCGRHLFLRGVREGHVQTPSAKGRTSQRGIGSRSEHGWANRVLSRVMASTLAHAAWTSGGKRSLRPMMKTRIPCRSNKALQARRSGSAALRGARANGPLLTQFHELDLCQLHQLLDFRRRPIEVVDRKCVDRDVRYLQSQKKIKHLRSIMIKK